MFFMARSSIAITSWSRTSRAEVRCRKSAREARTLRWARATLATARAYTRFITDRVIRNAVLGRQLPRLAAAAGFRVQRVIPVTAVYRDAREADQVLGL